MHIRAAGRVFPKGMTTPVAPRLSKQRGVGVRQKHSSAHGVRVSSSTSETDLK